MKKIQCELCGSNDLVKERDFFVCQSCDTKYSAEDAKRMLNININVSSGGLSAEEQIQKYKDLAANAFKANNYFEASSYCQRILELDTKDNDAWYLKGLTSALMNILSRNYVIDECVHCFCQTVDYANEKEKAVWSGKILEELNKLIIIAFNRMNEEFNIYNLSSAVKVIDVFLSQIEKGCYPLFTKYNPNKLPEIKKAMANSVNNIACRIWDNEVFPTLPQNVKTHMVDVNDAVNNARLIVRMLKTAAGIRGSVSDSGLSEYDNIVKIYASLIEGLKYDFNITKQKYEKTRTPDKAVLKELVDTVMDAHAHIKELKPEHKIPSRRVYEGQNGHGCLIGVIVLAVILIIAAASI